METYQTSQFASPTGRSAQDLKPGRHGGHLLCLLLTYFQPVQTMTGRWTKYSDTVPGRQWRLPGNLVGKLQVELVGESGHHLVPLKEHHIQLVGLKKQFTGPTVIGFRERLEGLGN
jgi:hypothetical protein